MKKFTFLIVVLMLFSFKVVLSQDTTAIRFISISNNGDITFFLDDTTDFYRTNMDFNLNNNATGHGLFVYPGDGMLYAVADPDNDYSSTTRKLYKINPLTGGTTMFFDLADHTTSAAVTPEGRVFTIDGNGGAIPGAIYEIDMIGLTRTQVAVSDVPNGQPRAMVYNPNDSSLYVYSSFLDSVYVMKLDTWTQTHLWAYTEGEVHGGFYRDNQFWLGGYSGEITHVNLADSLGGPVIKTNTGGSGNMAISEFRMLAGPIQNYILPGQQIMINSLYESSAFQWYRNDTLMPGENNDTLIITMPGDYKLLAEIDTSTNQIWSETIQVTTPGITDLLFIGTGGWGDDILFFNPDTTDFTTVNSTVDINMGFVGTSLFINPADNLLYGVADPDNDFATTTRKIYKINPLTGQYDLIMDLADWTTDAAITPEGRLFTIDGNGGTIPGAIYEIDLTNLTRTQVAQSGVTDGEPRTMTYNPLDSSLYVYSADNGSTSDTLYIMKVDTWTETKHFCVVDDGEVHGSFYRDNKIWLSSYYGEILLVDLSVSYDAYTVATSNYNVMDIAEITLLNETDDIGVCLNEPFDVVLHAKYPSSQYYWYKDGMLIVGENSDSLSVFDYGDYRLLTEIDTSGNYIWSEIINIHSLNVPNVSVYALDTLWCPGDSIQLSGSSGGTSQWYLNGNMIAGADSNYYYATAIGVYNMTKTNLNGCTDSASVGITIVEDPGCTINVDEIDLYNNVVVYPTPFSNQINIESKLNDINRVIITDIKGSVIFEKDVLGKQFLIDASSFNSGIYVIEIVSENNTISKKLIKQ